ncbi:MAG: trypsin-like peptidase domain-containing protein [Myxococcaceae bacterium]|nr:trypsin-like peptidase domain-containing protein [Myxococcaceae bacterium]
MKARSLGVVFAVAAQVALAQPVTPKEVALPSLAPLVESVKGAVVNIDVRKEVKGDELASLPLPLRRRSGGLPPTTQGSGSGVIIDSKGLVLTNNHVVADALSIRVRLDDGRTLEAEILGRDPLTDLALLRVKGKPERLPSVALGDSGQLRVGDWVVAIGNPFGLAHSVTLGIISAKDRDISAGPYDQFLQTDAAINPGNSGGPLFNLRGEVVGINTAINAAANSIGFSVPSTLAKALVPQLEARGFVVRGWLGLAPQDISPALARALNVPGGEGALVVSVTEGGPASRAGVKDEDVIVALDGIKVPSASALVRMVGLKRPDAPATLSLWREGKPLELKVTLGTRPDVEGIGAVERPQEGDEKRPAAPRLGLAFDDLDPRFASATGLKGGAAVVEVTPGSPAEKGGLRRGMVVTEANHKPVKNRDELLKELKAVRPGDVVLLRTVVPGGGRGLQAIEVP